MTRLGGACDFVRAYRSGSFACPHPPKRLPTTNPVLPAANLSYLEHVPKKLTDFFDQNMLQVVVLERIPIGCFHPIGIRSKSAPKTSAEMEAVKSAYSVL
jgi:hypothetical protein